MRWLWLGLLPAVIALSACGDDDVRPLGDAGTDTSVPVPPPMRDMGPPPEDVGTRDMGGDTEPGDTGPEDAGPEDMGTEEPCTSPGTSEDIVCGMCGSQTRFCTSARVWEYSDCEGEHGVCQAGDVGRIDCGGTEIDALCNADCAWIPADRDERCPLPGCADPLEVTLVVGETVSVNVDTRYGEAGPLALGPGCGGMPAMRPAQVVVAVEIPGTTARLVQLTLVNDATTPTWDTLVEVRRTECSVAPDGGPFPTATCFDDTVDPMTGANDPRSTGAFAAVGGETVHLVVTGFGLAGGTPDRMPTGMGRLDLTLGDEIEPPTLTAATVSVNPEVSTIMLTGGDPNGDATGARVTWLNAMGAAIDTNGDSMVDAGDDSIFGLDPGLAGMTSFTTTITDAFLATRLEGRMAARARIVLTDATGLESAPLTVDATVVTLAAFGEACDAVRVCRAPLLCTAGTCQASPEATAACAAATALTLTGTPATTSAMGMLAAGPSALFTGSCGSTMGGPEALYTVTVPAGTWDLLVST
ncbi:MAG: hypothetical protein IT379_29810, partial [Deltaproteobacteria bacterium]|nr:hypothetical protein [Deltaproteobacteria bacterium]